MVPEQYIWFIWTLILLAVWGIVFALLRSRSSRREMLAVSIWTALFGLTEPLFVPEYWSPPSLFDLARRTGFDIESIFWTFAIAGIAVVVYELVFPTVHERMSEADMRLPRHRFHPWAIISGPIVFFAFAFLTPLNPIYAVFIAAAVGGLAAIVCRPDLARKMIVSGILFTAFYAFYFFALIALAPGYVERVWNIGEISGVLVLGIPLEELIFAFSVGFWWSSIYDHVRWYKLKRR